MEWISVEDRLPPIFTEVLIYPRPEFNDVEMFSGWLDTKEQWETVVGDNFGVYDQAIKVTHWMPLPEPPK